MAVDEFKIRDLERRVRELETVVASIRSSFRSRQLGTKEAPLESVYLKDPKNGRISKISNNSGEDLRFETVR